MPTVVVDRYAMLGNGRFVLEPGATARLRARESTLRVDRHVTVEDTLPTE